MRRRWTLSTVLWVAWYLFLCLCAGFGAFTFAENIGLGPDWASIAGTIAAICVGVPLERDLADRGIE